MNRTPLFLLLSLLLLSMASALIVAQEKPKNEAPQSEVSKDPPKDSKASTPAAAMPAVDEILDKYVKALGGKETLEKLNTRIIKGSLDIDAMNMGGSFEKFDKAPNKSSTRISIQGFGDINSVYDGTKGWAVDPFTGFRELSGIELAATKREADFRSALNFKKNYTKLEVKGKEKVESSEAYVVEATPAEGGDPEKFYFDVKSGLIVRHDSERESPQGKLSAEEYLTDYKEIDGVKIPFTTKFVTPAFALTFKIAEVQHNAEIDEAKFNKPSATQ
ncbi:MAG: hypothetical protein J2P31_19085 [Blastocatellia bacterium]|nr:hypothetical protein [Blastocatellia bacterium]